MEDQLIKAVAYDGQVRLSSLVATHMVQEGCQRHDTWSTASAALGRSLMGGALLASDIKDDAIITLKIMGNGPVGKILVTANGKGEVKGYLDQPHVSLEENSKGKLDVKGAVGEEGSLTVIKDLGLKEPFSGQVPLVSGELAEDLTYYLAVSEQIPSAVGLGVLVNPDESIQAAGGWMIQMMPGATEETIQAVEEAVQSLPHVTQLIEEGMDASQIANRLLPQGDVKILDTRTVTFQCSCSKERFSKGLISLGEKGIQQLIDEDGQAEAVCHFCNEKYAYNRQELEDLLALSRSSSDKKK